MSLDPESDSISPRGPTGLSVQDAIARRVSCRAYLPKPVSEPHVTRILEAARLAPSACNVQPWRFAVVRDPGLRRRVVEEGFLPGIKMTWAIDAPVHVVIGMERSFVTHRLAASVSGVDYPWVDIGIAGEHLVLAATELGLGTCWIGWIQPRVVAKIVGWPAAVKPVIVITVGYPRDPAAGIPPVFRRKPLAELVRWL
ncbi:MAG: nitroreductase family protein [Opitutaceae bacterium]|nr:nitroreductase family protein [Opitutaceae bacterium]